MKLVFLFLILGISPGLSTQGFAVCAHVKVKSLANNKDLPIKEVGGIIAHNTIWYADTVYVVTDNILVFQDITLEIQAGTQVRFNQGRGINVEGGRLHILGAKNDSVVLHPNHVGDEVWNWQGISLNSINNPGDVLVNFAVIEKAVQGIRGQETNYIQVRNSRISGSFFIGLALTNSSFCDIEKNLFTDNYLGMEITASGEENHALHNRITQNIFSNFIMNISIQGNNQGALSQTLIQDNIIKNALHGIWLFNSSQQVSSETTISRNIIKNNGSENDGFGMYVSMDSVFAVQNLFWRNTTGVSFTVSTGSYFHYNSLFENNNSLVFRSNSLNTQVSFNTISRNVYDVAAFLSWEGVSFQSNNIHHNVKDSSFVINRTPFDITIDKNYWGTIIDSLISRFIYDKNDNHLLGELIYKPFSTEPHLDAPVSPPNPFISQIIDGQTHLLWHQNPESDLAGYRIFYGDFQHYTFSDSTEFITDTSYVLPFVHEGFLAIAAYTFQANGVSDLFRGYKSPYAFVKMYPYAGKDSIVCADILAYEITGSSLPDDFSGFSWTTSGDGYFQNNDPLNPLYFPGVSDRDSGSVTISLIVEVDDDIFSDSFHLAFAQPPKVHAGHDDFIAPSTGFLTEYAEIINTTHVLWETMGDGVFDHPENLLTTYTPGSIDQEVGRVTLVLHAFSLWCEPVSDTLQLWVRLHYSLEGRVWEGSNPSSGNPLLAIMLNEPDELPVRSIAFSDNEGKFRFERLPEGSYVLYAVTDTTSSFWPVYYASRSRWDDAFVIDLNGDVYELDVHLALSDYILPKGMGEISGHFELPDFSAHLLSVYCRPWFDDSNNGFCDKGLSNVSILLFSSSRKKVYGHVLSDANGNFYFNDLPFGTYVLEAEIAGFTSAVSDEIVVSPSEPSLSNIKLIVETGAKISIALPEPANFHSPKILFYPNPVIDQINLFCSDFEEGEVVSLQIFDLTGRQVLDAKVQSWAQKVTQPLYSLPEGLYFLRWTTTSNLNGSFLFSKQ